MTITRFDKPTCRTLAKDIEAALAEVAKKHGVTIQYAGGRFQDTSLAMKLEVKVADPEVQAKAAQIEFASLAPLFRLTGAHYGREFTAQGKRYRLVGFQPRKRKYPIRAHDIAAGKDILFSEMIIDRILLQDKAA